MNMRDGANRQVDESDHRSGPSRGARVFWVSALARWAHRLVGAAPGTPNPGYRGTFSSGRL